MEVFPCHTTTPVRIATRDVPHPDLRSGRTGNLRQVNSLLIRGEEPIISSTPGRPCIASTGSSRSSPSWSRDVRGSSLPRRR
jgi:hypothetical protein